MATPLQDLEVAQSGIALLESVKGGTPTGSLALWQVIAAGHVDIAADGGIPTAVTAAKLEVPYRALGVLYGADGGSYTAMADALAAYILALVPVPPPVDPTTENFLGIDGSLVDPTKYAGTSHGTATAAILNNALRFNVAPGSSFMVTSAISKKNSGLTGAWLPSNPLTTEYLISSVRSSGGRAASIDFATSEYILGLLPMGVAGGDLTPRVEISKVLGGGGPVTIGSLPLPFTAGVPMRWILEAVNITDASAVFQGVRVRAKVWADPTGVTQPPDVWSVNYLDTTSPINNAGVWQVEAIGPVGGTVNITPTLDTIHWYDLVDEVETIAGGGGGGGGTTPPTSTVYQAELATLSGGPAIATDHSNYTGSGFASWPAIEASYIEFTVTTTGATAAAALTVTFAENSGPTAGRTVAVNGSVIAANAVFASTGSWDVWGTIQFSAVSLASGSNTVRLSNLGANANGGGLNIDKLTVDIPGSGGVIVGPGMSSRQARRAEDFRLHCGIGTHPGYAVYEGAISTVQAKLIELGVGTWRGQWTGFGSAAAWRAVCSAAYAAGCRNNYSSGQINSNLAAVHAEMATMLAATPGSIYSLEGPNEQDNNPSLRAFTQSIWNTIRLSANPAVAAVKIWGPSLANVGSSGPYVNLGNIEGWCDAANVHNYTGGHMMDDSYMDGMLSWTGQFNMPTKKTIMTSENGFSPFGTGNGQVQGAIGPNNPPQARPPEDIVATLALRTYFEQWRRGWLASYLYELVDEGTDGTFEMTFGLLHHDFTARPAFTAIKNAMALYKDRGAGATFTPGQLIHSLGGINSATRTDLCQKANGHFLLEVHQQVEPWDRGTATRLTNTPVPLRFDFPVARTVSRFVPEVSASAAETVAGVTTYTFNSTEKSSIIEIS